jgi:alkylhydroperoxidase/carboxymuconolactone decarboxylase family protein YurZ
MARRMTHADIIGVRRYDMTSVRTGVVAAAVLLCSSASGAQAADCDRACLAGMITKYVDAMVAHTPQSLPLAAAVRFTEDSRELPLGDGAWKTVTRAGTFPQDYLDVVRPSVAQKLIGDFAPKLLELTDNVLFGDVWERPELSKRDRSLITVSALIALHRPDQLRRHLQRARDNGLTREELVETITHLAFYAGWPNAMTAVLIARELFETPA